jgi:aspartokinase-like uncharacterized kinase
MIRKGKAAHILIVNRLDGVFSKFDSTRVVLEVGSKTFPEASTESSELFPHPIVPTQYDSEERANQSCRGATQDWIQLLLS